MNFYRLTYPHYSVGMTMKKFTAATCMQKPAYIWAVNTVVAVICKHQNTHGDWMNTVTDVTSKSCV